MKTHDNPGDGDINLTPLILAIMKEDDFPRDGRALNGRHIRGKICHSLMKRLMLEIRHGIHFSRSAKKVLESKKNG